MTLKNAAWVLVAALALFVAVSTYNDYRPGDPSRERLFERRSRLAVPARPRPAPGIIIVRDETFANPSSIQHELPLSPAPAPSPISTPAPTPTPLRTLRETQQRGERVVVTGGPEGLRVEVRPAQSAPARP